MEVKSVMKGVGVGLALSAYPYAGALWDLPYTLGQGWHVILIFISHLIFIVYYYEFILYASIILALSAEKDIKEAKKMYYKTNLGVAGYVVTHIASIYILSFMFMFLNYSNAYKDESGLLSATIPLLIFWLCAGLTDGVVNKLLRVLDYSVGKK